MGAEPRLQAGTLTLLLTDIEGSSRSLFSEALHLSQKYQSRNHESACMWGLARVARAEGDVSEAVRHLNRAVDIYKGAP